MMKEKKVKENHSTVVRKILFSTLFLVLGLNVFLLVACGWGGEFSGYKVAMQGDDGLDGKGSYIRKGSEQLVAENLELALEYFEQAIFYEEECALAWRGVGLVRFMHYDFAGAREALETSLELGGVETAVIYNVLGVSAMKALDYSSAIVFFDLGIDLMDREKMEMADDARESEIDFFQSETLQSMMFNRIVSYQRLSDWSGAREAASKYLLVFPDDEDVQREYVFLQTR